MHALLFKEDSVEVEEANKELGYTQFLETLIKVIQFKVIPHTS